MTPLFDCSPAIAAKLARCEAMAREQRRLSRILPEREDGLMTAEDLNIHWARNGHWAHEIRKPYWQSLNA